MAGNDLMPKVDKPSIDASTHEWMKLVEKQNLDRVLKLKKIRQRNIITGLCLGTAVMSIYAYSILSVKQETFLDDFEVPKLAPVKEENAKLL